MSLSTPPVHVSLPVAPLRPYISHYWLSLNNSDESFPVTPDGAVDVIVVVGGATSGVYAYGTTTKRTEVPLEIGSHYFGVRFRPGQSRHFLDARTSELTNALHSADGAFLPDVSGLAESISVGSSFRHLDAVLLRHFKRQPPRHTRIDDVIRHIETTPGTMGVSELANMYCKSRRQFERTFLDVVGLSPKLFAQITRFRRASALLANSSLPLVQIAAVIGYTDQSHFTHEFARFFGLPPLRAREHAAFVQDASLLNEHNGDSLYI